MRLRYLLEFNRLPPPSYKGKWKPDPVKQAHTSLYEAVGCASLLVLNNKTASAVVTDNLSGRVYQVYADFSKTYIKEVFNEPYSSSRYQRQTRHGNPSRKLGRKPRGR